VVRVSVEVRSGAARFRVGVQARSIERAVRLVRGSYPDGDARVIFPIDGAKYFVGDVGAQGEQIEFEEPQKAVA